MVYHSGFMGTRSTNDPYYRALGEALKKARLDADVTPSEAASYAGLSHSNAIARYENGTRTPDIKTLHSLSIAYATSPQSLMMQAATASQQINEIKKGTNVKRKEEKE